MDQQAAERAKAAAGTGAVTGVGTAGEESKEPPCGAVVTEAEVEVEVKQEQAPPVSPQITTDDASIMQALDKNKECKLCNFDCNYYWSGRLGFC